MAFRFNVFSGTFDIDTDTAFTALSWKQPVANYAALPPSGNSDGDVRVTLDTSLAYEWDGASWVVLNQITVTDTNSIDLTLSGQDLSADLKLSAQAASVGYYKASSTIQSDGLHVEAPISDASNTGFLSNTDWSTFNNKENAITATTSADYYRGDKTFQPLDTDAVVEATNLYFTDVRAQDAVFGTSVFKVGPGQQYTTIQSALNAIGDATSTADVQSPKLVLISGGVYDEDLTIPRGRLLTLMAEGTVILGNGAGSNWSSTNSRSISVTYDTADIFSATHRPALNIGVLAPADATSTFLSQSSCWKISGNLNIAGTGQTHTINLHGVEINGTVTKTATGLTNLQAYRSYFKGAINAGTSTILERAYDCQFDALVTIDGYNALINCEVKAGMTVTTNYNALPPSGFFFTTFTGTFTGPANSLKLDLTSDYFFRANGATLGGSATKVLLAPTASSSVTGVLSSTDWSTFNGKQDAGNYITALTGDVSASGPGSASATLSNTTVVAGSYIGADITVDGKGRLTAASSRASTGDIKETSFSAANNQSSAADVTGFLFSNIVVRSFKALVSVSVDATADLFEVFQLEGIQRGSDWVLITESYGDNSQFVFSITNSGQIQYTSANYAGFSSATIKFRATTTSV